MKENSKKITRRTFLGTTGAVAAGLTILPSSVVSGIGQRPGSKRQAEYRSRWNRWHGELKPKKCTASENIIIALCDVDWGYAKRVFEANPNAKAYWDWRKMYDEMGKSIDAVIVATADHSHESLHQMLSSLANMFIARNL